MNRIHLIAALGLVALLSACGGDALEIVGTYDNAFSMEEVITEQSWGQTLIQEYDNDANWVVTMNADDAMFGPGTYSKVVWTEPTDGAFFYCTVDFFKPTLEAAKTSTQTADASEPATTGCGGFPWTGMTAK